MSKPAVGKLLDSKKLPPRDAIHVPIIPVVVDTGIPLAAGTPVVLYRDVDNAFRAKLPTGSEKPVGIIDPYLIGAVIEDDACYCFLRPNSVKKLWHDWTHPGIDE